mgnify:CR=1 FL=1
MVADALFRLANQMSISIVEGETSHVIWEAYKVD